ncbi:outer membrane lipoprotein LolB [Geobacter sp. DSM 9736]|uniref:outer membrane lipoprotein LolB n=1 Tax=Geobacter sp. DSM 9736 TaxID=1277350 RepID=UPI000B5E3A0D|nr:outer membrane lipoprotein LolB [Geobacter sp. DSM 9736]SNB47651.1 Outer membrane lipoprotein LolB, involved in outer membrane biogenesis [Geobacter sp. DSM 9736]
MMFSKAYRKIFCSAILLLLAGCATVPKAPQFFRPGVQLETLTAAVSVSVKTPTGGTGGNGYLAYRKPDRLRLVMLTPFGTTALEFCTEGDRATLAIPSKDVAYVGAVADLPEGNGMQVWRLMSWAVEADPLYDPALPGTVARSDAGGGRYLAYYGDDGLLERKVTEEGDTVHYRDYQSIDGAPLPSVMEFSDTRGVRVKVTLKEPEINQPLEDAAFSPHLEGLSITPLSQFRGM